LWLLRKPLGNVTVILAEVVDRVAALDTAQNGSTADRRPLDNGFSAKDVFARLEARVLVVHIGIAGHRDTPSCPHQPAPRMRFVGTNAPPERLSMPSSLCSAIRNLPT
jgi:hypothetical protein